MTSEAYQMNLFEDLDKWTFSAEDFRVRVSRLLEADEVSEMNEVISSLKLHASQSFLDPLIFSLKTSQDSLVMEEVIPLRPSSARLMPWGIMWNGKCLTARTSEFHKTDKGSSLSDILEDEVPNQYFLSEATTGKLLNYQKSEQIPLPRNTQGDKGTDRTLLKVNRRE